MNETNNKPSGGNHYASQKAGTEKKTGGRYLSDEVRAERVKRRRRNKRIRTAIGVASVILLLLIVVLCIKAFSGNDGFKGTWDLDGTTVYEFDGSGKGAMVLPNNEYEFTYNVDEENKTISIDFADEKANDYTYTYELSGNKLILSGGDEDETFTYEFTKK